MVRTLAIQHIDQDSHFRWRGEHVTRIENLSDIVFALALGMIASASSPPTTFAGLNAHLISIVPVAASFVVLLQIWNAHFVFFRRYNLADGRIVFLNACLLLLVLFIAYPVRFIFDSLFGYLLGVSGDWTRMRSMEITGFADAARITAYFAAGLAVLQALISMMYAHAYARRETLDLDDKERVITKREIWQARTEVVIALGAAAAALFTRLGPFAGFILFANYLFEGLFRFVFPLEPRRPKTR
ncbi:MAG: TMEM175 family protein [Pseudomonadota bacterium]